MHVCLQLLPRVSEAREAARALQDQAGGAGSLRPHTHAVVAYGLIHQYFRPHALAVGWATVGWASEASSFKSASMSVYLICSMHDLCVYNYMRSRRLRC